MTRVLAVLLFQEGDLAVGSVIYPTPARSSSALLVNSCSQSNLRSSHNGTITTHSFLFGALAELLDNARDAGAARLDVFSVNNEKLQGGFMLCFLDDGCGMSPDEASDIIYFGTSKKCLSTLKFIGQYGNGLKSGSMRIGKDFILFTKKEETMTCVFFSQTFCEREGLSEVLVPIPSWLTRTRESVLDDPQKFSMELSIIYKYSPFKTEAELMQQFDVIYGKCGTLLVIYNLKLLLSGEPELDVKTDKEDILMAGALEDFPERWSFRAYTSVLYFDPQMRIFIQAKRVKTKHLCYSLYRPRKYLYVTTSFKGTFKNEVKKAEEAVKIAEFKLKEIQFQINNRNRTSSSPAKEALQKALEDVEAKHKNLKEKQRIKKSKKHFPCFSEANIENRSQAGMFIYSNSRLIKMHEKVGPQLKLKSLLGAGVVGIVNIPLEIMEPSHNKQEFLNVQEYNHLLKVMGQYLVQYCKDTGISNRNLTPFWNEFGYQNNKGVEKSLDSVQCQRRQAMAIPFIIQCDLCLKWRVLPSSTNYQEKECLDIWICANNPNPLENSCQKTEHLPSIPLGTMSTMSPSKNEKEKQLRESVQRYQNKLEEQQPQKLQFIPTSRITEFTTTGQTSAPMENTKTHKIRSPDDYLKHESLPSFELSVSPKGQKRNTEGSDSDIEYISETKIRKKTMQKKVKPQLQRCPRAPAESAKVAERFQASSWEMKRKQSQNLVQECTALSEVGTNNNDPDIILISDKSDTDVSLKQEKKEVLLMNKEKQELCDVAPEIKKNSSLSNWESVLMEGLRPTSGHTASFSVNEDCKVASSLKKSSQSTSVRGTVTKLMSSLREILLYFFPEYQLPSEFDYTSLEELVASSELEQCPEQINKKLKMCFNQIQSVYMVQYEKRLKRKMQSVTCDANRREVVSKIYLEQCEKKRKIIEDKLKNLRVKLGLLLQKLQLGGPASELEQIDSYLEALLKEDNLLFQNTLNKVTTDMGQNLPVEKNKIVS
ncbi:LOW QUALITY PROTEIN: MORC family CW-type zinc finger protein 1 [Choloepus didactylus]|uniref:LOW QUALITY PROTEIN: MORC family CW-type zinc finger protein 1 n=1 Tax=Choloepus didactylus TaxID=27675 RepID=UPI00189E852A|nr:LOW QUALITY PROTEIN: MORC family CW-type zinc finger protein 1 [Choloepus didactylus]